MKIMVCLDESEVSKKVLELAVEHAKIFSAQIELVTTLEKGGEDEQQDISEADARLEKTKSVFDDIGIPCTTHLLIRGLSHGKDLAEFAADNGIEEIIIGIRRKSKVGKLVFGSTAQYVILKANCPVVTVK